MFVYVSNVISLSLFCVAYSSVYCVESSYDDQKSWGGVCNTGKKQSPVNIITSEEDVKYIKHLNLSLINYAKPELKAAIKNNGRTVKIALDKTPRFVMLQSSLHSSPAKYKLQQMHIHWGSKVHTGSEHCLNSIKSDLECHFIHWNTRYTSFAEAEEKPDGLLVIAVIYRLAPRNNVKFGVVTNMVKAVQHPNTTHISQQPLNLLDILPQVIAYPQDENYYGNSVYISKKIPKYRRQPLFAVYKGSLTIPPCSESVTWIVFLKPLNLEKRQKKVFNGVLRDNHGKEEPIGNNYRYIQPLNDRVFTIAKDYTFNVKRFSCHC